MPNGFGFGRRGGGGWGMGFGFRGSSPPWPYVGLGRGGLPRCGYFLSGAAGVPLEWPYLQTPYPANPGVAPFSAGQAPYPFYGGVPTQTAPGTPAAPGAVPFAPQMTPEQELHFLQSQAEAIKEQLEQMESRMRDLEAED
jgi:hypothetical protein